MNNFATHHVAEVVVEESTQFTALWCTECGAVEDELHTHECAWHQRKTQQSQFAVGIILIAIILLSLYLGVTA